jgi:hypothetical protein
VSSFQLAAALAVFGAVACSPERDATSSQPLLSNPLGVAPSVTAVAEPRGAAQPKEEAERRSH